MTARSATTSELLADEMRSRVLAHGAARLAIRRPECLDYDPAEFTITDDDRRLALEARDPRAIELELRELRLEFWQATTPGRVRLVARECVRLSRHLWRRSLQSRTTPT